MTNNKTTTQLARATYAKHATVADVGATDSPKWIAPQDMDFHELRACLGAAFAGTETVKGEPLLGWTASHLSEQDWYTHDEHRQVCTFGLGFPIYDALQLPKESLIVARKGSDETKDKEGSVAVAAAAVIVEYNPKKKEGFWSKMCYGWRTMWAFMTMAKVGKMPQLYTESQYKADMKYYHEKLDDSFLKTIDQWHRDDGPEEVHWYIRTVGVEPSHHGQGLGRELMEEVNSLADEQQVIQYLECGTNNVGFYERMGYKVRAQKMLKDPVDPSSDSKGCGIVVMVRSPQVIS